MKCIGAFSPSVSVQTGENIPGNVYTQSNLLAGKGIEIINEPVEGGIDENTLACWHFDDSLEDAVSGINFNTNVDTDPTYTTSTDGFGNCLLNSRSTFGSFSSWLFSDKKFYNTSFTVDFKFILRSTGAIAVQTGHSGGLTFYIDSSSIISKYNSTNRETYSYSLSRDSWHHVAFVKNGNVINYYIDGVFVHSYTYAESDINSFDGKESSFGLKVYNSSDNGNIDELRISDIARPLTADGKFPVPTRPYSLAVPTGNKVINNTGVTSINTKSGNVTLTADDINVTYTHEGTETTTSIKEFADTVDHSIENLNSLMPVNAYTAENLIAGKNITIEEVLPEGGIDNHTLACWHFDDGVTDSVTGLALTRGTVSIFTDYYKFGTGSGHARSSDYNNDITTLGLNPLEKSITLDFWAKAVSSNASIRIGFFNGSGSSASSVLATAISQTKVELYGKVWASSKTLTDIVPSDIFNHYVLQFAYEKQKVSFYFNGTKIVEEAVASTLSSSDFTYLKASEYYGNGRIDEMRISDVARYDGAFTPPTKAYSLAVPTGNKVINNTLDVSSLVTKEEVSTGLSTKQDTITGSNGEVAYHNGTGVFTQSILNLGYACVSTAEVNQCKNNAPSFSAVFNTWKKFSHKNATNDAIPSEMTAWTYDSGTDTITQPLNTESYVGFISPKSYSSYDITVRCYSTGSDDDSIGLVAAFAKDSNGLEHTLSFIRSPGGTSAKWVAILDYNQFALTGTSYGQKILVNNSAASTTPASTANWNTESIGTGTVIKMVRSGNVITAKCSQFNSNTIDDNTLITVDLDALSDENPTLNLFKGSSPWGYSNFSQPNSKYENISVTDPDGMIFDIPNNQVLQYSNGTWVVVSGQTPISAIGAGRLSYNSVTGKLFFCTGTDIIQIGKNTDI